MFAHYNGIILWPNVCFGKLYQNVEGNIKLCKMQFFNIFNIK